MVVGDDAQRIDCSEGLRGGNSGIGASGGDFQFRRRDRVEVDERRTAVEIISRWLLATNDSRLRFRESKTRPARIRIRIYPQSQRQHVRPITDKPILQVDHRNPPRATRHQQRQLCGE